MRPFLVNQVEISETSDAYVVAEIGHNHQGSLERCEQLFRAAKLAGAHAVKLQKRSNRDLFTSDMYDSPYVGENAYGSTYGAHRESLEFGLSEYRVLRRLASDLGLAFFSTAFDHASADFLAELDVPAFKIASGDIKHLALIRHVARFGKPIFMSTGGATLEEVRQAYEAAYAINPRIALLQCTSNYPSAAHELNLKVIQTYKREFPEAIIGFSDHHAGTAMAVVAYALGARVIEKHFTLNRALKGTDHSFSLEPMHLRQMVEDLRDARQAMGDGVKRPISSEVPHLAKMSKVIVASQALPAGHVLREADLAYRCSLEGGLPPSAAQTLVGRSLTVSLSTEQKVEKSHVS